MKKIQSILYITTITLLFSCGSSTKTVTSSEDKKVLEIVEPIKEFIAETTVTNNPNTIEFNFLQLNDVYEIAPIQGGKFGGMARVETIHKKLQEENPNTMLFMAGDFLNPSLLGTIKVDGERLRGRQMIDVMNNMNFDLVAFGNHEFDLSYKDLQKRLNESNFEWISANVMHKKNDRNFYFEKNINGRKYPVNDSFIQQLTDADGTQIKIGFISVCIPSNPKNYVSYGDMLIEAERSYLEIKDQVDIVFGLTHVKLENDKNIAKILPNVPLIMGGHEHTNSNNFIGNVQISKADANAKTVYIHRIIYDKTTKTTSVNSELVTVDNSIPEDALVKETVNKWQKILKTKIKEIISNPDSVIYTTKEPLEARDTPIRSIQTNMGDVITKSMSFAFDNSVDCALVNGGSIRIDDVLEGDLNAVDIFRVLPYGGAVLKVNLKGSLLKQVLDYGLEAAGTGAYLQRYNVKKVGEEWQVQNAPLDTEKIYAVAFSDYLLKGFDIPFLSDRNSEVYTIIKPEETDLASDIRKSVIEYLASLSK